MRKIISLLKVFIILFFVQNIIAQERFIDVRQDMADNLSSIKIAVEKSDWEEARKSFQKALNIWQQEVKPMIVEGVKTDEQFQEYFDRLDEIDRDFQNLSQLLGNTEDSEIEAQVNALIWGISHHPRGFDVPNPRYSIWDWIFGLGIGIGFCLFAVFFGMYLQRSYYRRYKKIER